MKQLVNKEIRQRLNLSQQVGMTLLEVLVATGILVVISGMAFFSLNTLVQSKQSLEAANNEINQYNLAQFQLQNDIQMAVTSNLSTLGLATAEFVANSQTITLLRFQSNTVPNQRNSQTDIRQTEQRLTQQNLIRVRWYLRNDQWYRASQSAASPLNSNQWQERAMLELNSLSCSYQNKAGLQQSSWPSQQSQNTQLPEMINCQVEAANGQASVLKLVPWQQAGWL